MRGSWGTMGLGLKKIKLFHTKINHQNGSLTIIARRVVSRTVYHFRHSKSTRFPTDHVCPHTVTANTLCLPAHHGPCMNFACQHATGCARNWLIGVVVGVPGLSGGLGEPFSHRQLAEGHQNRRVSDFGCLPTHHAFQHTMHHRLFFSLGFGCWSE